MGTAKATTGTASFLRPFSTLIMVDLISGTQCEFDLTHFSPQRFAAQASIAEEYPAALPLSNLYR